MAANDSSFQNALRNSPANARFSKLTRLLIDGGTIIFRELFDHVYPPEVLVEILNDHNGEEYKILQRMRRNNLLYKKQCEVLFPTSGPDSVTSKSFDITLLYKLLVEFCDLFLAKKVFTRELLQDLQKIKDYRNEVYAHAKKMETSEGQFETLWKEIKDALLRIVKCYNPELFSEYQTAISNLYHAPINGYPDVDVRCTIKVVATEKTMEGSGSLLKRLFKVESNFAKLRVDIQNVLPEGVVLVNVKSRTSTDLILWAIELYPLDEFWERYETGNLKEELKTKFTKRLRKITKDETLQLASFDVTVEKRDYEEAREYLLSTSYSGEKLSNIWRFDNCVSTKETSDEEKISPIIVTDPIHLTSVTEEPNPVQREQDESIIIKPGEPLEDRGSKYQGYLIEIRDPEDVTNALIKLGIGGNTDSTKPKLHMWGYRLNNPCTEKFYSGSEYLGGQRILEMLKKKNVTNVMVVVTFCGGGIPLGKDRFKNYQKCIDNLIRENIREVESHGGKDVGGKRGTSGVSVGKLKSSKTKGSKKGKTASKRKK